MGTWTRRILITLGVIAVLAGIAYYVLLINGGSPPGPAFAIDMSEIRKLADSLPGDKASEVRVEEEGRGAFPGIFVIAGDSWQSLPMAFMSYQLVFPQSTVVIDTGFDQAVAKANKMEFHDDVYARISKALTAASLILVTHEHGDHIGGLLGEPNLKDLLAHTKLNKAQVDNAARYNETMRKDALKGYRPIDYDRYLAVAPGVVLIKAPGHTPGSQMVYVKTANGAEFLFLGDVAWHMRNVELVRGRARFTSWYFLHEDRDAVLNELAALHALAAAEPKLHIVAGHDPGPVVALIKDGAMQKGFH
jgi:glyoxylase-like metal-dependent hydrolase (beta-lactamase superfamily II)